MVRKVPTSAKSATTTTTKAKPRRTNNKPKEDHDDRADLLSQIRIDLKHKNEVQKQLTTAIKNGAVTLCTGPAGTGKTLLAVAEALLLLKNHQDKYYDIKLAKSILQLKDEDLGTLPGDANDKLRFIMMSFLDAFYLLIGEELTEKLFEAGYVKFEVFGALRGRSIPNSIIIIDEFQNVTDTNGKTFLTRFSDTSKVVVLGDSNQIDIKNPKDSCFAELVKFCRAYPDEEVNVIEFTEKEIVRSRLTRYFIKIFEHPDYKKPKSVIETKPILLSESFKKDVKKTEKPSWFKRFLNLFK